MRFKGQTLGGRIKVSLIRIIIMAVLHFCYGNLLLIEPAGTDTEIAAGARLNCMAEISGESLEVLKINEGITDEGLKLSFDNEPDIIRKENLQTGSGLSAFDTQLKKVDSEAKEQIKVIPCGMTVGVKIETDGIMVLGCAYVNGEDGTAYNPAEGLIIQGDMILSINGREVENNSQLRDEIQNSPDGVNIKIKREEKLIEVFIKPVMCIDGGMSKIGVWVRDSTQGIGTVTYINPETLKFGALGHGIMDVDTKKLMSVKSGELTSAQVYSIKKGKKGSPGELVGDIEEGEHFGNVKLNSQYGLYGIVENAGAWLQMEAIPIAQHNQITEGPAVILSNIGVNDVEEFQVYIESLNKYSADDSKGMVIKITDEKLLEKTSGIVQGMSGSPILQNGMIVGAVTHVFVQDPTKGYGIFIEKMLNQENSF